MDQRQPLILVTDPAMVSSGLMPDRHPLQAPLWQTGENARFYQGKVRRLVPPQFLYRPAPHPIRGLSQHRDGAGTRRIWSAAGQYVHRWAGQHPELIHTFAAWQEHETPTATATFVDFTHWGDWTLINNGKGAAQLHKPGQALAPLANAPVNVLQFMKKQNQLMAIGYGGNKRLVGWTDADAITVWAAAPDNLAGSLLIEEFDTEIKAASRLGQFISLYAEDQLGMVFWVGAPFYYGQRVALDGIGAVGKAAVVSDGRLNYGVSRNGVWRTDGTEADYIDEGMLSDYLQDEVNWDQASKIVAARNDVTRTIEFHFPMRESLINNEAWSFDPKHGSWSKVPAGEYATERKLFDKPLLGGNGGAVAFIEEDLFAAAPLVLRTKPLTVASQRDQTGLQTSSWVDQVEFMLKAVRGVEFRYAVAELLDDNWVYSKWQPLSTDQRTYAIEWETGPITGTYHRLEFRSTINNWQFDLQGFLLFGIGDGGKRGKA